MGIPLEFVIYFSFISLFLTLLTLALLFIEPNFNKAVFAIIVSFINGIFSYIAGLNFTVIDLYGYDYTGAIVSNNTSDFYMYSIIFFVFTYFSIAFILYGVYLLSAKPWKQATHKTSIAKDYWNTTD